MLLFVPSSIIFLNETNYFTNPDDASLLVTVETSEIYLHQPITIHIENNGTQVIHTASDGVIIGIKQPNGLSAGGSIDISTNVLEPNKPVSVEWNPPLNNIQIRGINLGEYEIIVNYKLHARYYQVNYGFEVIDFERTDFSELVNSGIESTWIRYDYVICKQTPWLEEYTPVSWRLKERTNTYMAKSFFEKNNVHVYDMKTGETIFNDGSKPVIEEAQCGKIRGESEYFLIKKEFLDKALDLGNFNHAKYLPW